MSRTETNDTEIRGDIPGGSIIENSDGKIHEKISAISTATNKESEVVENTLSRPVIEWKWHEKFVFRIFFIFFFLLVVPLDFDYYARWFTLDWANLHIRDLGSLSGSRLHFMKINTESGEFGLASYVNWGITFLIAVVGGIIWTILDKRSRNYRVLYYFILVAVSFSMAVRLQGLTFSKVFPSQMPALALTQLNTDLGDFTPQKLYWIQLSFVHGYEILLGLVELLIMLFLFFRKTRALGAALALAMIGNIAIANHVYDGGIHLAASFYALGGIFVLWPYLPGIWNLLVKQKDVAPVIYYFPFAKKWQRYLRLGIKIFIFSVFFVLSAYKHWENYTYDSYKVPANPGLTNARGFYNVTEFRLNNNPLPYSPTDSLRWRDVTFENWSTISFSVHNTFLIHGEAGRGKQYKDVDRTYESAGTGGGRRHYYYEADTVNKVLRLQNKNKVYKDQELELHYERASDSRILLWGKNEYADSIHVVLDKAERIYPLYEDRSKEIAWLP